MKRVEHILAGVMLSVLAGIVVLLPVHAFISTWGGTAIGPLDVWKSWKEILLLVMVPVVISYCIIRLDVAKTIWNRWINKYIALYVLLNLVFAVTSDASTNAIVAGLLMNLRYLAIFVLAQVVLASGHPWLARVKDWAVKWLLWTTVVLAVLAIAQVALVPKDFLGSFGYNKDTTIAPYVLVDQNPNALRAFATMRGPNELGAYLLLPLALAAYMTVRNRRNVLAGAALGLGVVALALTGSRSAWLGAAATLVMLAVISLPRDTLKLWVKRLAIPAAVVVAGAFVLATTVPAVRLAVFHSSPGDPSLTEGSTDNHWRATADGIRDVLNNPFGQGVGTAGPASYYNTNHAAKIAENYFVQIGQEIGLLGLLLFGIIMAFIVRQLWARRADMWPRVLLASLVGVTLINMLLHAWVDEATSMTWWALAGLFAYDGGKR